MKVISYQYDHPKICSARLHLPGPEQKSIINSGNNETDQNPTESITQLDLPLLENANQGAEILQTEVGRQLESISEINIISSTSDHHLDNTKSLLSCSISNLLVKETEWNNNVLEDIFSRLSLKSLARCRCVCKDWLILVYLPFFFKLNGFIVQRKWLSDTTNTFIQLEGSRENMNTLLFNLLPKDMLIMDTCNGLILCGSNSPKSTPFVWNPVNGQLAIFPFSSMEISLTTAIASDSYQSCCNSISFPKFKLVRIVSGHRSRSIKFEVYSSETGACRVSNGTYDSSRRISITSRSIYIKGVLYWIMNRQKLLSFHVEEELTSLISLPCNYPSALNHQVIGESEGILHYAQISKPLYLRVWCLDDETWELKYHLNIVIVLEKYKPNSNGRVALLCFKDSMLLLKIQGYVIGYDLKNSKVICVYSYEDLNLQSPPASPYQKPPFYPLLSVTNVFPFPL